MSADRWEMVTANGASFACSIAGRGAPVVFVHGSLDDLRSWRHQIKPFAAAFRVVAYSRRYHYPNPWAGDGSDYAAELHADDLAALIRELGLAPAHLVTSSYGGDVALHMAAREPALVRSLVLAEPPLLPWLEHIPGGVPLRAAFVEQTWEPARRAFEQGRLEEGARRFLDGVMGRPTFVHLSPAARAMILDNAPEMRAETLANRYFPPFDCRDAGRIACPVLLLGGELSPRMFHLISAELARCLPSSRTAAIPGASHAMHVGNPKAYNDTVLSFLQTAGRD